MQQKLAPLALFSICFFDYRLHACGPWTKLKLYPLEFGGLVDQSALLIALILLSLGLLLPFFAQQTTHLSNRSPKSRWISPLLARTLIFPALLYWLYISGLPFSHQASSQTLWVNRMALHLSTMAYELPFTALALSAAHCLLCIVLWNDWQRTHLATQRRNGILFLGLIGLIALGTDALLGYASGSPFFVLE